MIIVAVATIASFVLLRMQQVTDFSSVSMIDLAQLRLRRRANSRLVLVEALPRSYFEAGHIPGALHLPHDVSDAAILQTLPEAGAETVVYCASATCPNSHGLATRLAKLGYTAVSVFSEGKAGWVQTGETLEK